MSGAVPTYNTLARSTELDHGYPEAPTSSPSEALPDSPEAEMNISDIFENSEQV